MQSKANRYPIHKERFDERRAKMQTQRAFAIDPIWAMQCEMCLAHYYGSYWRVGWYLVWKAIVWRWNNVTTRIAIGFCDWIGWTKMREMPDIPGCFERHAASCDKLNCQDMDCHRRDIPKWFQRLTRMPKYE